MQPNPSTAMARAVVDEMVRCGVALAVVSPGSRSAALAIAAHQHQGMTVWVTLDERAAAFQALGWSKATGRPAAVISTSGTAPANYLPAVAEADMSLTPLVVVSADRPAELRGVGANQTIDQVELYGRKARIFADIPAPEPGEDLNESWRSTVSNALHHACGAETRPGPVHLNIGFREPTVPVRDDGRSVARGYPFSIEGQEEGRPWLSMSPSPPPNASIPVAGPVRGVVVAGDGEYDRQGLLAAADGIGWPVLATSLSGLRGAGVVTRYHHMLVSDLPHSLLPEAVVAVGAIGPSDRLERLMGAGAARVRVDRWGRRIDPERSATHILHADPVTALGDLRGVVSADDGWSHAWLEADRLVGEAIDQMVDGSADMTGAGAVRSLLDLEWSALVAASSLPVREVDAHLTKHGRVIANRGASGIDGFVSTSIGVAAAFERTLALSGDLSLLHDSTAFLTDGVPDLVIAVLDNGGGGIFDMLPPARHAPDFERLFVSPHGRDLVHLARLHGLGYATAGSRDDVAGAVGEGLAAGGAHLVRIPIDRQVDLKQRRALDELGGTIMGSLHS